MKGGKDYMLKMFDVIQVDLGTAIGSEQGNERPAVIIQNDVGNAHSPTILIIPMTTEVKRLYLPTHQIIHKNKKNGLDIDSMLLGEQTRVIDKRRIKYRRGILSSEEERKSVIQVYLANITGRKYSEIV